MTLIIIVVIIYKKKPEILDSLKSDRPNFIIADKRNQKESVIFEKGIHLKNNVVFTTEDEKKIIEEFHTLETQVAESITPVMKTDISREEDNAKHNRYKDMG